MEVDQVEKGDSADTVISVEVIHMKLLRADTDAKVQSVTDRHLCDLLDLMGKRPDLRKNVGEVLNQYNKMSKSNLAIRLPLTRLLELFQSENVVTSTFALIYLKYAKYRNTDSEHLEALPVYLKSMSKKPDNLDHIYDLLSLSIPGLFILSKTEKKNWPTLDLSPAVVKILARTFTVLMIFFNRNINEVRIISELKGDQQRDLRTPATSVAEYQQVCRKIFNEEFNLTDTKIMILKCMEKEIFEEKIAFPVALFGTVSGLNEVDDYAIGYLKKIPTEIFVNDKSVVEQLMRNYLGSEADGKIPTDKVQVIQVCGDRAKAAILHYLNKSNIAMKTYMNNIKIVNNAVRIEYIKTRTEALYFLIRVLEHMPQVGVEQLTPKLFEYLKWRTRTDVPESIALCLNYRVLSIIGIRNPKLLVSDPHVLTYTISQLEMESAEDVCAAISQCLASWLPIYKQSDDQTMRAMVKRVIKEYIVASKPQTRLVALKYAEALLDEDDMEVRWMLLMASGDKREGIQVEALRQLEKSFENPPPPAILVIGSSWSSLQKDFRRVETERQEMMFHPLIHINTARYLYGMMETEVMHKPAHLRIVEGDDHWMTVAPRIVKYIVDMNSVDMAAKAAEMTIYSTTLSTDAHVARIATTFQAGLRAKAGKNISEVLPFFSKHTQATIVKLRDSTRMEFSNAFAYLLTSILHENTDVRWTVLKAGMNDLKDKDIPGISWICAACVTPVLGAEFKLEVSAFDVIKDGYLPIIIRGYERPSSTLEATLGALCFVLQYQPNLFDYVQHKETIEELVKNCEKIAVSRQDTFSQKTRECAARAIGLISGNLDSQSNGYELCASSLNRFGEGPPQQELQLTVGEAICDAILGNFAVTKRDSHLVDPDEIVLAERLGSEERLKIVNDRLTMFIRDTLADKKINNNQHFRRAELVWLLVVVQNFGKWKADVLKNGDILTEIQEAFADGLTENDDFSQDISSKGMGVVYGLADQALRKRLVDSLMTTLTEGKRSETKLQGDTQIFAKGEMGTTPTGEKLTTYQELLTLASDLNQPDLVYKFMQLARHNAIWNSKMGAAHGFGALLENAKEELEPYFNQLVPKLFRLRYDPNGKVQAAMKSIWGILTANRKNVVDEFANEIAKELLPAITDREYRVRESACLALSDLLRGHDTPEMHKMIPQYLESVLRVRDDHKESSREAANRAADAISKLVVRLGSSSNLQKSNEFLSIVLPAVVNQGILNSSVKANTIFCLKLVLELTKHAGKQLKPYMADLIPMLMDSISEHETPLLNYIAVRATSEQMEALDDARSSMARSSPMMTAINDLLPHIDSQVLIDMTPKLSETLRSSVGVTTRSSAAQFVTQLALRAPQLLMDHSAQCDKLFTAIIPGVRDRNPSIRKQFANTISYLAKFVSPNQMKKLIRTVVADLLTNDEDQKMACCHVLSNLAVNSAEMLEGYKTEIVPYVFLEFCREVPKGDELARQKKEKWNEVWSELVPSTSAAVRLYKDEILNLATEMVTNNEVWAVRKQAAVMIGETFEQLKQDAGFETAKKAAFCLLENLNGRIWEGKIEILKALTKTFLAGGDQFKQHLQPNEAEEIVKVLRREAAKKNTEYASAGLSTLAAWSVVTGDVQSAHWLAEKTLENITKLTGTRDGDESDDQMEGLSNAEKEIRVAQLVTPNLVALAMSLPTFNDSDSAANSLELIATLVRNPLIAWKSKQFFFVELARTMEKWRPKQPVNAKQLVDNLLEEADEMCNLQRKTVAADALQILLRMQDRAKSFGIDWQSVADRASCGTAGATTGLGSRFESKMETD